MTSVTIHGLVKKHGANTIVRGLDLTITSGEILSVLGPSGCGKTTLLRCLAGLETIDRGSITLGDRVVAGNGAWVPPEKRNIGLVFQSYALWPHLTVFGNVALGLKIRHMPKAEIAERVAVALGRLELSGLADRYPSQLSGGQQQRVALARAIVLEPQVLLFDEPLSNLDARIRERVRGELHDLMRKLAITTLYVTHDKAEAMAISDRIVIMKDGAIAQIGSGRDIYERPASRFIADFIGRCNLLPVRAHDGASDGSPIMIEGAPLSIAAPGEPAIGVIAFRPDEIEFAQADGTGVPFSAEIEKQIYFGTSIEVSARLGGHPITVHTRRLAETDRLDFQVPKQQLLFFADHIAGADRAATQQ